MFQTTDVLVSLTGSSIAPMLAAFANKPYPVLVEDWRKEVGLRLRFRFELSGLQPGVAHLRQRSFIACSLLTTATRNQLNKQRTQAQQIL